MLTDFVNARNKTAKQAYLYKKEVIGLRKKLIGHGYDLPSDGHARKLLGESAFQVDERGASTHRSKTRTSP